MDLLLTFADAATGRVRFHATTLAMMERQTAATVVDRARRAATTWEAMPAELERTLADLRAHGYEGVVLGDIHLADVRAWYETRVRAAGLAHVEPLWAEPALTLLTEFVASGGRAVVTCVDTTRLDESWLGRRLDDTFVSDIAKLPVDACGENGEYHTFAYAGPAFRQPVRWLPGERRFDGRFAQLDILPG